jgi:RNA polymerase subunit RPABC4/transcription elongation factor Spt4
MESTTARQPHEKFCRDCGRLILERAEICPSCGCRQAPPLQFSNSPSCQSQPLLAAADPIAGRMGVVLALNFLWNGLGNIAVGDRRGWGYGFLNWIFLVVGWFTLFIPTVLFYAYCGYQGHEYLRLADRLWQSKSSSFEPNHTPITLGLSAGQPIRSVLVPEPLFCERCGAKLPDIAKFCPECGKTICAAV